MSFLRILSILLFFSCSSKSIYENPILYSGDEIKIEKLYYQKEIPGYEEDSIKIYLHLDVWLKQGSEIILDSLLVNDKSFDLSAEQSEYKFRVSKNSHESIEMNSSATLFFSLNGKTNVLKKAPTIQEDLFLP